MNFAKCPLYLLQSKNRLYHMLGLNSRQFFRQEYIATLIEPYIDKNKKPRLIEAPHNSLKIIQKKLKLYLSYIEYPPYVFSGIKGRSYADNAFFHIKTTGEKNWIYKVDLTAFFPSTARESVYSFFLTDLKCSPDIAAILTNFTTIDLTKVRTNNHDSIHQFLNNKGVTCNNHLISGSPTSQLLSYLANRKMFEEIKALSDKHSITMTIYVDDLTFSSMKKIPYSFKKSVAEIVKRYGHCLSPGKVKSYSPKAPKLITGVVISGNGKPVVKNSLQHSIVKEYEHLKDYPDDIKCLHRLRGLLSAARQIENNIFPSIYQYAFEKERNKHISE